MTAGLITIVGAPASGKTTLSAQLAEILSAQQIREDYRSNPFLHEAYLGSDAADLPCQIYFLMSRARQLAQSTFSDEGLYVADYDFCMDAVYAQTRLAGSDWQTYQKLHQRVEPLIRQADILVHLRVSVQTLLDRIAQRGRNHEKAITPKFLASLSEAYDRMDLSQRAGAVIQIDAETCDLRRRESCQTIAQQLRRIMEARI